MTTRGRGRPAIGPALFVRLPPEQLAALDRMAATFSVSRAEVVRRLLAEALGLDRG